MRVLEVSADEDLAPFSRFLWQQRVSHRIFEERGMQVVEIAEPTLAGEVEKAYQAWRDGRLTLRTEVDPARGEVSDPAVWTTRLRRAFLAYPGVLIILLLSLLVAPFSLNLAPAGISERVILALTIVDLRVTPTVDAAILLGDAQIWRWLTPVFLHFSIAHLAFNCVVTLDLGRRIELIQGTGYFLLVVVLTGVFGNLAQALFSGYPLFGGLSGVAYGLLGYLLVMQKRFPADPRWQLPAGFAIGLLVFLVLFSTGVTEFIGLYIANAAHWAGLCCGVLLALLSKPRVRA
jgi:GlpG protein